MGENDKNEAYSGQSTHIFGELVPYETADQFQVPHVMTGTRFRCTSWKRKTSSTWVTVSKWAKTCIRSFASWFASTQRVKAHSFLLQVRTKQPDPEKQWSVYGSCNSNTKYFVVPGNADGLYLFGSKKFASIKPTMEPLSGKVCFRECIALANQFAILV